MKPKKIGTAQVVNIETGEVVSERKNAFTLLPPAGNVCQECAVDHAWNEPHDQQSVYYQMQFHATHGRHPTWSDALAHCDDATKAHWRRRLVEVMIENGLSVPKDLTDPKPTGR